MRHKFRIGDIVTFSFKNRFSDGEIKEITVFRRENIIGYGIMSKVSENLVYRAEDEIKRSNFKKSKNQWLKQQTVKRSIA